MPIQIQSINTLARFITLFNEEMFNTIHHNACGEITEEDYYTSLSEINHEEATDFIAHCAFTKKFVEDYGMFKAFRLHTSHYGVDILMNRDSEEKFYAELLFAILIVSEESIGERTYERFNTYREKLAMVARFTALLGWSEGESDDNEGESQ